MSCLVITDRRRLGLELALAHDKEVGLVPTMGALHRGHGALIGRARADCNRVIVSLFVNPTQFDRKEDYERYARNLEADAAYCDALGADILWAPPVEDMYPRPGLIHVEPGTMADHLCGKFRPGHFRGVLTVVAKLLHIVQPSRAYFGRKDGQQLALIRRMVADLDFPIEIVGVDTVREDDGLALSSRNERLTAEGRRAAPVLYRALCLVRDGLAGDVEQALAAGRAVLAAEPGVRTEYLEVVDAENLQPVASVSAPVMIATAAWVDGTRLIDNVVVEPRP